MKLVTSEVWTDHVRRMNGYATDLSKGEFYDQIYLEVHQDVWRRVNLHVGLLIANHIYSIDELIEEPSKP